MGETCFFYSRTNGCRHGTECTKTHRNAGGGRVVVVRTMYLYPKNDPLSALDEIETQVHADLFYEDWFTELSLVYGAIRRLVIASNNCSQLLGNIYVEFENEADAARCVDGMCKRYYSQRRIVAEFGNCHRVDEAVCSDCARGCGKGGQCSFVHPIKVSEDLVSELFVSQRLFYSRHNRHVPGDPGGGHRYR